METDFLLPIGKSLIQHGYYNNRIYLINIHPHDIESVLKRINYLQLVYSYEKIILKVPKGFSRDFITPDTRIEATIPGYFQGVDDAVFLSRFFSAERADEQTYYRIQKNIQNCTDNSLSSIQKDYSPSVIIREATYPDIPGICSLYQRVFETYPFPIKEPQYLKKIMDSGIPFFIAETSMGIIAAGSCEIDSYASAVEMSDLAVDPRFRGFGLSKSVLTIMEEKMRNMKVKTAFTICRAEPIQINRLFSRFGYQYGGTLIKNTNICGKFESMNVWYKWLLCNEKRREYQRRMEDILQPGGKKHFII